MLTKTIKFTDFNDVERKEEVCFNLTKSEIMKLELTTYGGISTRLQKIIDSPDIPTLTGIFEDLIMWSYGEKSEDGKYFDKGEDFSLFKKFKTTPAYDILFMELLGDANAAADFILGIVPKDLRMQLEANPQYLELVKK